MRWRHQFGWGRGAGRQCLESAEVSPDGFVLSRLRPGASAEVCGVMAGAKARVRLASLGLIPGSKLHVVANPGIGPLLLSVGESRLMVERGVADKVMVQQV